MSASFFPAKLRLLRAAVALCLGALSVLAQYAQVDPDYPKGGGPESFVRSMAAESSGSVLVGGVFTNIGGIDQRYLARVKANGEVDLAFAPQVSSYPEKIQALADGRILISGNITSVNGAIVAGLALLMPDGSMDGSFQPPEPSRGAQLTGTVSPDGSVWVTGGFTNLGGVRINGIARLFPSGIPDPAFQSPFEPGVSAKVLAIQSDGKPILSGVFIAPGVSTNSIVRLEKNGMLDPAYATRLLPEERISRGVLQPDDRLIAAVYRSIVDVVDLDYAIAPPRLVRLATNGAFDPGFNLQTEAPGLSYSGGVLGMFLQSDDRIVVYGTFQKIGGIGRGKIARVLQDGSVDQCFDVPFAGDWSLLAAAAASDGSIIVGGSFRFVAGQERLNLARLVPQACAPGVIGMSVPSLEWRREAGPVLVPVVRQGGLDLEQTVSFSTGISPVQSGTVTFAPGQRSQIIALPLEPGPHEVFLTHTGGGATLAAQTNTLVTISDSPSPGTAGRPDTNYVVRLDGEIQSVEVLPDGRAYISGYFTNVNGDLCPGIARLHADGRRDQSFNRPQRIGYSFNDVAVDLSGRVLVAGYFTKVDGVEMPSLARLNLDGSLDQSFAPLGRWGTNANGTAEAYSVAVLADGSILCGAYVPVSEDAGVDRILKFSESGELDPSFGTGLPAQVYSVSLRPLASGYIYAAGAGLGATVTRLRADGSLDTSFIPPNDLHGTYYSSRIEILPDGRVVISAPPSVFGGLLSAPRLWRANPDGSFDTGFALQSYGSDGLLDSLDAYAVEPDGAVLVSGYFKQSSRRQLAKFHANGSPDWSFDSGTGFAASSYVNAIKALPAGGWLIGGEFTGYAGFSQKHLVKLLPKEVSRRMTFSFASTNITLRETNVTLRLEVRRRGDASTSASVSVHTIDGSAVAGQDYVPLQTNLLFAAGEWMRSVEINVLNEPFVEPTESFTVALTNSTAGFAIEQPSTVSITIQNDDADLAFVKPVYETVEEDGYAIVSVKWSGAVVAGMSAWMRIVPISGSGEDIEVSSIAFSYAGITNWLRIPIRENTQHQETRLFRLELTAPENVYIAPQSVAFLAIEDRDFVTTPARGVSGILNVVVPSPGGGVYLAGEFTGVHGQPRKNVARLLPNGEVDLAFNPGTGPDGVVFATAVQSDNKLVIGGSFTQCNGIPRAGVARLNADGTLDATFDPGSGPVATDASACVYHLAVAPDDKICVGGVFTQFGDRYGIAIAKLLTNGAVDTTFTSPFRAPSITPLRPPALPPLPPVPGFSTILRSMRVQPDGNILVSGSFYMTGWSPFGVARLFSNGQVDATISTTSAYCAAPAPDGKVLAGFATSTRNPALIRLQTNGAIDTTFQFRNLPIASSASYFVRDVVVEANDRILCTLLMHQSSSSPPRSVIERAIVLRVLPDGAWDASFTPLVCDLPLLTVRSPFWYNQNQTLYETPPAPNVKFAVQPDGVLVLGGAFDSINGEPRRRLARAKLDGSLRGRLLLSLENGNPLKLGFPSEAEAPYIVETSANLLEWMPWLINQYPWSGAELLLPANEPARFFRLQPVP